ncbi:hypothetical protein [Aquimarina sp. 2201CG14-23]|uniref:hypothetical protein n=1 Tax=Aquimarina mycalae TaxID=3040073 RepID=UPI002477EF63|nr:hypothetical protein [Aquimarina sp. 2201CG14-23]MDH7447621.1 hypothetical protein [Aquimarina sp. 2201CG14-23]
MKKKIKLFLIIVVSIIGIGFFIVEYIRKDNSEKYHATAECENTELNYVKEIFKTGITHASFKKKLKQNSIEAFFEWENANTKFIALRDILKECPSSGRQYCGITFEFENNKLTDIYPGYPCH